MQGFKSPCATFVKKSRLLTASRKYDMHSGVKLITLNHRLIYSCGVSLQKFLKLLLLPFRISELFGFSRKITETIWLKKLESTSNEMEMTNFSVYIITVFTNYAFGMLGLGFSEESEKRFV